MSWPLEHGADRGRMHSIDVGFRRANVPNAGSRRAGWRRPSRMRKKCAMGDIAHGASGLPHLCEGMRGARCAVGPRAHDRPSEEPALWSPELLKSVYSDYGRPVRCVNIHMLNLLHLDDFFCRFRHGAYFVTIGVPGFSVVAHHGYQVGQACCRWGLGDASVCLTIFIRRIVRRGLRGDGRPGGIDVSTTGRIAAKRPSPRRVPATLAGSFCGYGFSLRGVFG